MRRMKSALLNKEFVMAVNAKALCVGGAVALFVASELITVAGGQTAAVLVDDFEEGRGKNKLGGYWFTYSDKDLGGSSIVHPVPGTDFAVASPGARKSEYCARMKGQVTTKYRWGFVGMGCDLRHPKRPVDLSGFTGIEFYARGDGRKYRVKFSSDVTKDGDDFGADFEAKKDWRLVRIAFSELAQQGWGKPGRWAESGPGKGPEVKGYAGQKVLRIQWQTIGQPLEAVRLDIDDIKLLKRVDM